MKQCIFVPADDSERNKKANEMFTNSLRKFHKDIELRFFPNPNPADVDFWYRAKPIIASQLFKEGYDTIIGMDNDQIITGSLDDILNDTDTYDVGVVQNDPTYPIGVWDITHPNYFNNGLVVLKSKEFVDHWLKLCMSSHFKKYQYREQDLLNALCSDYYNYKVKRLDSSQKVYGEVVKPQWINATVKDGKICLQDAQICVIHFGGGNTPDKFNYRIKFQEDVVKRIEELIQ